MHRDSFAAHTLGTPPRRPADPPVARSGSRPSERTTLAVLRALASATGLLLPGTTVLFRTDDNDRHVCQAAVTRLPYPGGHPIRYGAEADLDDCFTGTQAWWDSTRATLAEVAEARALRLAFPELRGLLTVDEPNPSATAAA